MSGIDPIGAVNLAWKLYHECWLVASDAPDGFRLLVIELHSTRNLLTQIRDIASTASPNLDPTGRQRLGTLQQEAEHTTQTLKKLGKILEKFKLLASGSGRRAYWARVQWAREQSNIRQLQQRLLAHNHMMSLSFTTIEYGKLEQIQRRLEDALARLPASVPNSSDLEPVQGDYFLRENTPTSLAPSNDFSVLSDESSSTEYSLDDRPLGCVIVDLQRELQYTGPNRLLLIPSIELPVFDPPQPDCVVDSETNQRFNTAATMHRNEHIPISEWVICATWWLSKARNTAALYQQHERVRRKSLPDAELPDVHLSLIQGLDNLRKAAWIVYEKILNEADTKVHLEYHREILSLTSALQEEFMTYRKLDDELVETPVNPRETTHVWERQCHVELVKHYRPPPTDQKWITVESKDGGLKGEHVIYRSFVNAEIGGRELRNRSVNQPYMLILHCHDSHPEPKITLCSQRGLLNLTKDFTHDDLRAAELLLKTLQDPDRDPTKHHTLDLKSEQCDNTFEYEIEFQCPKDLEMFIQKPRRYFPAVEHRKRLTGEAYIYQTVVDSYTRMNPENDNDREATRKVCEVRIFEKADPNSWMRVRRIVINSAANDENPWCHHSFLPMDDVVIRSDATHPRVLNVRFSNCNHEIRPWRGDHNRNYSYIYNPSKPNNSFDLNFQCIEDAECFKSCILNFRENSQTTATTDGQLVSVHSIAGSKVAQVTSTISDSTTSTVFRIPPSLDIKLHNFTLNLSPVQRLTYISNHVNQTYPCDETAIFSHSAEIPDAWKLSFTNFRTLQDTLRAITHGWQLDDARTVKQVKYDDPAKRGLFSRRAVGSKVPAHVSVWTKDGMRRMAVRWDTGTGEFWMTVPLTSTTQCMPPATGSDSDKVLISSSGIVLGNQLELKEMEAAKDGGVGRELRGVLLAVQFASCKEKECFAEAARLHCP